MRDRAMDNEHRKKIFTSSDDEVIRRQPVTGVSVRRLATILRTNQEAIRHRATELGVSLVIGEDGDGAISSRRFRCTDGFVDPLLERLKSVYGAFK